MSDKSEDVEQFPAEKCESPLCGEDHMVGPWRRQ